MIKSCSQIKVFWGTSSAVPGFPARGACFILVAVRLPGSRGLILREEDTEGIACANDIFRLFRAPGRRDGGREGSIAKLPRRGTFRRGRGTSPRSLWRPDPFPPLRRDAASDLQDCTDPPREAPPASRAAPARGQSKTDGVREGAGYIHSFRKRAGECAKRCRMGSRSLYSFSSLRLLAFLLWMSSECFALTPVSRSFSSS